VGEAERERQQSGECIIIVTIERSAKLLRTWVPFLHYRGEGDMLVECCVMLNKLVPHVVVREGGSMVIKVSGKISGWVNEPVRCEGAK